MKRLFISFSLLLTAVAASAVPAKPGIWQTVRLADGTEARVELRGDEYCHYWRDAEGRTYLRQAGADVYFPASVDSLVSRAAQRRAEANSKRMRRMRRQEGAVTAAYTGTRKGLIILVDFPDRHFGEAHTRELYERVANEEGFTSDMGFKGSVSDYFRAQSDGVFDLKFDVVGPVEMPNRFRYYGEDYGGVGADRRPGLMITTACEAVDSQVNFADYDWDGDGEADQVFVLYAGQGQAAGGETNTIWPHEGKLSGLGAGDGVSPITLDGVKIDTYACSCELNQYKTIDGIGTICHEFSHCLGLRDMYDTASNSNFGMSVWSIMDFGNYLDGGFTPAPYTSYERMAAGWRQPVELTRDTTVLAMGALSDGGDTYIIRNEGHPDEYYMLENRQPTGWDAGQYGSGLLVLHVDYDAEAWNTNQVNSGRVQRCTVFHADNSDGFQFSDPEGYPDDIKGDPYPFGSNNSLTATSVPAATVNNPNADGSLLMGRSITAIRQNADGTVAFTFGKDDASGIGLQEADGGKKAVYTIGGRYVGTDTDRLERGVYVTGGKTVIK